MNEYEVWSEGYRVSGNECDATFHGVFKGATFSDACAEFAKTISRPGDFDPERLTYWGCELFDNEEDARRSFG